jgi:hypothetical protein
MSVMAMPPVVRAVGYYITFFGGLAISSLSAGFVAAGWSLDQYPIWLKIAVGAWPIWSAAFGLTAASHTPVKEEVVQPSERYRGYKPERAAPEDLPVDATPAQEDNAYDAGFQDADFEDDPQPTQMIETNQPELGEPAMSPFFKRDDK